MRTSHRVLLLAGICVAALVASVAFVVRGERSEESTAAPVPSVGSDAVRPLAADGTIVFRNLDRKQPSLYGFTASAPLRDPAARVTAALPCSRVYFAGGRGLCLEPAGALVKQRVTIVDRRFRPLGGVTLQGVPSRARVSPDGRYGSVTFFVYGHSYATPGNFSTQTTIIDLVKRKKLADIERFHVTKDGRKFDSPDFNFWGVTFAPNSDRFYATLATARQDVPRRRLGLGDGRHEFSATASSVPLSPLTASTSRSRSASGEAGQLAPSRSRRRDAARSPARRDQVGGRPGRVAGRRAGALRSRRRDLGRSCRRKRRAAPTAGIGGQPGRRPRVRLTRSQPEGRGKRGTSKRSSITEVCRVCGNWRAEPSVPAGAGRFGH